MAGKSLIPKSKAKTAFDLLSEVRVLILAEPKRYFQGRFIARRRGFGGADPKAPNGFPDCGTVGCVAGWVATLKRGRKFSYNDTEKIAAEILGLDLWTSQTHELFSANALGLSEPAPQTKKYALLGAAHIARFQEKYRTQLLAKKL